MGIQATRVLAEFVSDLVYKKLPSEVIEKCKEAVLDYLGAALAGYKEGSILSKRVVEIIINSGGKEEATIIGAGKKVPVLNAALVNGVLGHVAELDDGHRRALGHPGVTAVTAALAAGEYVGASGKELITAIVAGYDVFVRIASAINPSHLILGYHTTGTCGAFAAAAAVSNILKLDHEQTANALGLAGIQGAGLMEVTEDGQMAKPIHPGKAAQAGVLAALLAKEGSEGPKTVIEGNNGFAKAMSEECDYDLMLNDLGKEYHILTCYTKLYPSCRHTHPPIDAVLTLRQEENLKPYDILEVLIKTYPVAISLTGQIFKPETIAAGKFSIPYCVSAALVDGQVGIKQFKPNRLYDPEILELTDKVKIEVDHGIEKLYPKVRGAEVQITLKNGRTLKKRVNLPKGEVETPLSQEEMEAKFKYCTEDLFDGVRQDEVMQTVRKLDRIENVRELMQLLA